jgi:prophage tail gpP-like protein
VPGYTAHEHTVRVTGRSKTQDLIDCTPDVPGGQFSGYKLDQIAEAIAYPFGIRVHVLTEIGEPFYDATIERHETAFQFLERLARLRGVLLCDDELGDLILCNAGDVRATGALVQGVNILSASANLSGVRRFSEYRVKTQIGVQTRLPYLTSITPPVPSALPPTDAVVDQFLAAAAEAAEEEVPQTQVVTTTQAVAYDRGVPRFRPHVMIAESGLSADLAMRRATWQAKYNAARGMQLQVEVQGWRQADGKLWRINELMTLRSPYLQIDMELLCVGVTFELRPGAGRTTRLELGPVDGYQPDPGQVRARRNRGQAPIYNDLTRISP